MILPPPRSTLFPYTTLFRSKDFTHQQLQTFAAKPRAPGPAAFGAPGRGQPGGGVEADLDRLTLDARVAEQQLTETATAEVLQVYPGGIECLQIGDRASEHPRCTRRVQQYLAYPQWLASVQAQCCGLVRACRLVFLQQNLDPEIVLPRGHQPAGQGALIAQPVEQQAVRSAWVGRCRVPIGKHEQTLQMVW